jgi:hypothetical protein
LTFGASAAAGVLAAHWLAYRIVTPDAHARAEVLAGSGHRYLTLLSALVLGLFALAASRTATPECFRRNVRRVALWHLAIRLALFQTAGWLLLECAERALAAHHHGNLLHEPVFWIGLVLQIVVGAVSALLFASIGRVVAAFLGVRSIRAAAGRTLAWRLERPAPIRRLGLEGAGESRGPPYATATS